MWIKTTISPVMAGEPQLGNITEYELMKDKGEGLALLIMQMVDEQQTPESTFYVIDDYTDEEIELLTLAYVEPAQLEMLYEMFEDSQEWTEEQLSYILVYLTPPPIKGNK